MRSVDRSTEPIEISLWSRSLRISLSYWLSTWQLSKMSFSFDQKKKKKYPPIRNDGQKLMTWKWGSQWSWPKAFSSRLSALRVNKKNKQSGLRHKICQQRIKESLWDQGTLVITLDKWNIMNLFLYYPGAQTNHASYDWPVFISWDGPPIQCYWGKSQELWLWNCSLNWLLQTHSLVKLISD